MNCSKPKTVLICGDHICVNKQEAQQYFEENLTLEVKIIDKEDPENIDLVELNLNTTNEKVKEVNVFKKKETKNNRRFNELLISGLVGDRCRQSASHTARIANGHGTAATDHRGAGAAAAGAGAAGAAAAAAAALSFHEADLRSLPLADGSVDLVVAGWAVSYLKSEHEEWYADGTHGGPWRNEVDAALEEMVR